MGCFDRRRPRRVVRAANEPYTFHQGRNGLSNFLLSKNGLVAQLVRALACHARGRGFEPHPSRHSCPPADLAHLVERDLAKVEVAGSSPVIRSIRRHSQAVRQRSAKPSSPVRFRVAPPKNPARKCRIFYSSFFIIHHSFFIR